jgi:hypothetical protein
MVSSKGKGNAMNLYWVIIYPLGTKFPFKDYKSAKRLFNIANIYHEGEVELYILGDFHRED